MSKRVREWAKERKKLLEIFLNKDISICEARLNGCLGGMMLGFHHKRKRIEYYNCPEKLGDFNEAILCCVACHQKMEQDKELSRLMFKKLRE